MVKSHDRTASGSSQLRENSDSEEENGSDQDVSDGEDEEGFVTVKSKKKTKKGKNPTYYCKGGLGKPCGCIIAKKEHCIECESCGDWFHPKCQGLSMAAFQAIRTHNLFWVCYDCKMKFKETVYLGKIMARVEEAEKHH